MNILFIKFFLLFNKVGNKIQANGQPTTAQLAFALEKIANKKTIKIGRMKVTKNIFCIILKLSEEKIFFDRYKKGSMPKIKI